jgi:hypothetical protein
MGVKVLWKKSPKISRRRQTKTIKRIMEKIRTKRIITKRTIMLIKK